MDAVSRGRTRVWPPQIKEVNGQTRLPVKGGLKVEDLAYRSERGGSSQAWVPLRIMSSTTEGKGVRKPVVIFLHPTGHSMRTEHEKQESYAAAGYLTVAIDCRYHGERCPAVPGQEPRQVYQEAIVRAWREGPERPFLLDNVWDILALLDYLCTRPDVDTSRIGITGTSLGGMHSWLATVLDSRIAVSAPMIGVQSFNFAVESGQFQGRVESISNVFSAAQSDMGKSSLDSEVVAAVWRKIMPGLLEAYDAGQSLPLIAPRPLLVANGELDHRCPMEGVYPVWKVTQAAYMTAYRQEHPGSSKEAAEQAVAQLLKLYVEPGVGHKETPGMNKEIRQFMDQHLLKKQ